ncbi:MAG: hypothetical protein JW395_3268 [Nitrospira sp.]|nr:hypothetical protein [Nitrospira sp.]
MVSAFRLANHRLFANAEAWVPFSCLHWFQLPALDEALELLFNPARHRPGTLDVQDADLVVVTDRSILLRRR